MRIQNTYLWLVAAALVSVVVGSYFLVWRKDPKVAEPLLRVCEGQMLNGSVSLRSSDGTTFVAQLPEAVVESLRRLLITYQAGQDPRGIEASAPLAMLTLASDAGTYTLEWHYGHIVDRNVSPPTIWWSEEVSQASTYLGDAVTEHDADQELVESIALKWNEIVKRNAKNKIAK